MSDIRKYDSSVFGNFLADDLNDLVSFTFNDQMPEVSASLEMIVNQVLHKVDTSKLDTPEQLVAEVIKQYNALKRDPSSELLFDDVNRTVNAFADRLNASYNELTEQVYPQMQELKTQIKERTEKLLQENNLAELVDPANKDTHKLSFLDWDKVIDLQGGNESLAYVYKSINGTEANFTPSSVRTALNSKHYQIENLELNSESLFDIKKRYKAAIGDKYALEIDKLIGYMTSTYEFNKLVGTIEHLNNSNDIEKDIKATCKFVNELSGMVDVAKTTAINVSSITEDKIRSNLGKLSDTLSLAAYALATTRRTYRDALIISRDMINSDNLDEFKLQGGRLEDIDNYLQVTPEIPFGGVKGQEVLADKERDAKLVAQKHSDSFKQADALKSKYRYLAAQEVMKEYLERTPDKDLPEGVKIGEFVQSNESFVNSTLKGLDLTGDTNLESTIYNVILGVHYPNNLVERLHRMLGESFVSHVNVSEKMTEQDFTMMDIDTGLRVASEFIATKLI